VGLSKELKLIAAMQYSTVRTINHKVRIFMTSNEQEKLYAITLLHKNGKNA